MTFSAKTDEAFRKCIDTTNNVIKVTGTLNEGSYVAIGDSITAGSGSNPYTDYLSLKYTNSDFYNYAIGGERAVNFVQEQLIKGCGILQWRFTEDFYPWTDGGVNAEIIDKQLYIEQTAAGTETLSLICLPANVEVTIRGSYLSDSASRLKISSDQTANILTTTTEGDFTVTYTSLTSREEIRLSAVNGSTGEGVRPYNLEIELTDKSGCATAGGFILGGANDINSAEKAPRIFEALEFCARQFNEAGMPAWILQNTPFGGSAIDSSENRRVLNELRDLIKNSGEPTVDTSDIGFNEYIKSQFTADNLHPNEAGQELMAQMIDYAVWGDDSDKIKGYDAKNVRGFTVDPISSELDITGDEVIPDPEFTAWADPTVPDDFTKSGTHNPGVSYVEEATASGGLHLVTDGTNVGIRRTGATISGQLYLVYIDATAVTAGNVIIGLTSSAFVNVTKAGVFKQYIVADGTQLDIKRGSGVCDVTFAEISIKPVRFTYNADKKLVLSIVHNDDLHSEDVTNQTNDNCVDGAIDEIIGDATTDTHGRTSVISSIGGYNTQVVRAKSGDKDFLRYENQTTGLEAYVDVAKGISGTVDAGIDVNIVKVGDDYDVWFSEIYVEGNNTIFLGAASADNTPNYLGDGSTVDLYITRRQNYPGNIGDNVGYVKTVLLAKSEKRAQVVTDVDSKTALGLFENVSTGDFEVPAVATRYKAPNKNYERIYFGAETTGFSITTANEIGDSEIQVSDGTSTFTISGAYYDGTNSVDVKINNTTGVITVNYSGFTLVSGWVEYK